MIKGLHETIRHRFIAWAAVAAAVLSLAAVATEDLPILGPGDLVRISMVEDAEVSYEGPVSAMGTVRLPYLREFRVAGLTTPEAEKALSEALCKDLYHTASVSIALVQRAPGKVYVYGAVKQPGVVELPPKGEISIMQLVSEMGGLTSWAAPERAYIVRQQSGSTASGERIGVDLTQAFKEDAFQAMVPLRTGDILFVPGVDGSTQQIMSSDDCQVIIVGEVNAPGIVRFSPGEQRTLMRAIFKAAGFSKFARSKEVRLIRYGRDGTRLEQKVNASEIIDDGMLHKDVELLPGDMLIVPQRLINF